MSSIVWLFLLSYVFLKLSSENWPLSNKGCLWNSNGHIANVKWHLVAPILYALNSCHSSVVSSMSTILRPRVRFPSTPSTHFFNLYWNCNEKRTKINKRRLGFAHLKNNDVIAMNGEECFKSIIYQMGQIQPLFVYFRSSQITFLQKNCRCQRDSNSDCQSRRQTCWPLDNHHCL